MEVPRCVVHNVHGKGTWIFPGTFKCVVLNQEISMYLNTCGS